MLRALYTAASGMQAQQTNLDTIANNLANSSTAGFSPTIGIIGAVLGLIQVMQHLDQIDEVGRGIAVAFVATIYGVGLANLFFLPVAGKLKIRIREEQILREMTLEGVISILEGMNPRMLEATLQGFLTQARDLEVRPASARR
jgi:chemotaxis protein MotA